MKRILPFFYLVIVAVGIAVAVSATVARPNLPRTAMPAFFFVVPIVMLVLFAVIYRKLIWDLADSVDEARDCLLVRRGSVEQRVTFANILNVSMSQFTNPPRLTLRLRTPGLLGDEIVFIPKSQGIRLNPFKRNEIAEGLMRRVDQARNSGDVRK